MTTKNTATATAAKPAAAKTRRVGRPRLVTAPAPPLEATPAPKVRKDAPKLCGCGCEGMTKGGRYLPGHDAKHHSALKRAAAAVTPG